MAWNLRVSAALHQGDRKYMEDQYAIHYECDKDTGEFLYVYFGIFDGHGGAEAANFAKASLHKNITSNILFWSEKSDDVLKSIEAGFLKTHEDMWKELGSWPSTASGLPSTAGTTASIVFIKGNKLYCGHVGDSGICIGRQSESLGRGKWVAEHLTVDHKPDSKLEKSRIEKMGGKVVPKAGVPRVVWERPREKGPVRIPTEVDRIPFLAVARALGDLWSYNFDNQEYAISPKPDVTCVDLDPLNIKCIILATDGLWNLLDPKGAVATVEITDRKWFREAVYEKTYPKTGDPYYHHASTLVNIVLRRWRTRNLRADNTSAIVVMVDPPGPPVSKSIEKLVDVASQIRNGGQKFCARSYLKDTKDPLTDADRYVLGMAGSYNIQYYDDTDKFELLYGKPATRFNKPKGQDVSEASSSVSMYDVIIHKVVSPSKSSSNLKALLTPSPVSTIRRVQSSKELKRFRPASAITKFGSWLNKPNKDSIACLDPSNPDNLPVFIDEEENAIKRPDEELVQEDQAVDSPEHQSKVAESTDNEEAEESRQMSPDSTSHQSPVHEQSASKTQSNKNIVKCIKSLISRSEGSRMVTRKSSKLVNNIPDNTARRTAKNRTTNVPQLRMKRKSTYLDIGCRKKMRLSTAVQLTKISSVRSPLRSQKQRE